MRTLNPSSDNCRRRNGVIALGLVPEDRPTTAATSTTINVKVTHGNNLYRFVVPSNSTFGYLKSVVAQTFSLEPEMHKLFFGGQEKEDAENLQTAGVVDNSDVLLTKDATCEQKIPEEDQQTYLNSKGEEAVAEVRTEVDKLQQKVAAMKAVVDSGTKVDEKEIIYLTEMLMRQLLKLDGIEAEGQGKVQRKTEVRRVQSLVETLDALKSRNSNAISNEHRSVAGTTHPDPGCGSLRPIITTATRETFDPSCKSVSASNSMPSSASFPTPHFGLSSLPNDHAPYPPMPYNIPPTSMPSSAPFPYSHVAENWKHYYY